MRMASQRQGPLASRLQRSIDVPLWQQLLADLRTRLGDGEFSSDFPGELELVEQYAVSRHTVRESLRHLRTEGVVTANRGRRPRLAPAEVEQPLGALPSLFATVESRGLEQRSQVRALDLRADGVVAVRLGLEESTPLVYLERLRLAGDEPLALDRTWLPADVAQPLLDADFTRTALYDELAQHCGIRLTGGRERVRAVQPQRQPLRAGGARAVRSRGGRPQPGRRDDGVGCSGTAGRPRRRRSGRDRLMLPAALGLGLLIGLAREGGHVAAIVGALASSGGGLPRASGRSPAVGGTSLGT